MSGVIYSGTTVMRSSDATGAIVIRPGTTAISETAFSENMRITSITFNTDGALTTIGTFAFANCYGLTGDLNIPNSVTTIGGWAFQGSPGFTGNLIIPNSVTTIGENAFNGCSGLRGTLTISNSVTTIGPRAFQGCSGLSGTLTIPASVTTIGLAAFQGCSGLTAVRILGYGTQLTSVGDNLFSENSNITSVSALRGWMGPTTFGGFPIIVDTDIHNANYIGTEVGVNPPYISGAIVIRPGTTAIVERAFFGNTFITSITFTNDGALTTIGEAAFSGCSGLTGTLTIPDSVTTIGIEAFSGCSGLRGTLTISNSVTTIGPRAFYLCSGLSGTLTIPNSVTTIETQAFIGCSGLTGPLTIPNSVTTIGESAFQNCTGLTGNLTISNNVTRIGVSAFQGCSGLTGTLTIPASVTSIGDFAFNFCSGLTAVRILGDGSQLTSLGTSLLSYTNITRVSVNDGWVGPSTFGTDGVPIFSDGVPIVSDGVIYSGTIVIASPDATGAIVIRPGTTAISDGAFHGNTRITSITFNTDGALATIGGSAFYSCSGLTGDLNIPNSVTTIGDYAFLFCAGLTSARVLGDGSSVRTLGTRVFYGCAALTSIEIPNVTAIGTNVFDGCNRMAYAILGSGTSSVINGQTITMNAGITIVDKTITSFTIPSSITSISSTTFSGCTALRSITLPSSFTSIPANAFQGLSSLTSITIPPSCRSIEVSTFQGCSALTSMTIPPSCTSIGVSAFQGCSALTSITISSPCRSIPQDVFNGCSALTSIALPSSCSSIGASAFQGCGSLTMINIPTTHNSRGEFSVFTSIGDNAFKDCTNLRSWTRAVFTGSITNNTLTVSSVSSGSISIGSTLTGSGISDGTMITAQGKTASQYIVSKAQTVSSTTITAITSALPFGLTTLGSSVFSGSGMTGIIVPQTLGSINADFLSGCTNAIYALFLCGSVNINHNGATNMYYYKPNDIHWQNVPNFTRLNDVTNYSVDFPSVVVATLNIGGSDVLLYCPKALKNTPIAGYNSVSNPQIGLNATAYRFASNPDNVAAQITYLNHINYKEQGASSLLAAVIAASTMGNQSVYTQLEGRIASRVLSDYDATNMIEFLNATGRVSGTIAKPVFVAIPNGGKLPFPPKSGGSYFIAVPSDVNATYPIYASDGDKVEVKDGVKTFKSFRNGDTILTPGASYIVQGVWGDVRIEVNYLGSASGSVTPSSNSVAYLTLTFSNDDYGKITVTWSDYGTDFTYNLTISDPDTGNTLQTISNTTSGVVVEGLTYNTLYSFVLDIVLSIDGTPILSISEQYTTGPCFLADAPVLTPTGYRPIATLCVGDLVVTATGDPLPIVNIKKIRARPLPKNLPYIIPAGLYGAIQDLPISPHHMVRQPGKEARHLGLVRHPMTESWDYYNLELTDHAADMVVAGVVVETWKPWDGVDRLPSP